VQLEGEGVVGGLGPAEKEADPEPPLVDLYLAVRAELPEQLPLRNQEVLLVSLDRATGPPLARAFLALVPRAATAVFVVVAVVDVYRVAVLVELLLSATCKDEGKKK
jgi:hypothetical protein